MEAVHVGVVLPMACRHRTRVSQHCNDGAVKHAAQVRPSSTTIFPDSHVTHPNRGTAPVHLSTHMALSPQHGDPLQVCPFLNPYGIVGIAKTCFIRPSSPIVLLTLSPRIHRGHLINGSPKPALSCSHALSRHPINYQRQSSTGMMFSSIQSELSLTLPIDAV